MINNTNAQEPHSHHHRHRTPIPAERQTTIAALLSQPSPVLGPLFELPPLKAPRFSLAITHGRDLRNRFKETYIPALCSLLTKNVGAEAVAAVTGFRTSKSHGLLFQLEPGPGALIASDIILFENGGMWSVENVWVQVGLYVHPVEATVTAIQMNPDLRLPQKPTTVRHADLIPAVNLMDLMDGESAAQKF
ncbi:hypothetical protein HDU79_001388, partial [Rhizoclosmatium sp. JEL0117]